MAVLTKDEVDALRNADLNGDGVVSAEEHAIYIERMRREMEDEDAARDLAREQEAKRYEQQAKMASISLWCMVAAYPLLIVGASLVHADQAVDALTSMATVFFPSVSIIIGAFYGFTNMKKGEEKSK